MKKLFQFCLLLIAGLLVPGCGTVVTFLMGPNHLNVRLLSPRLVHATTCEGLPATEWTDPYIPFYEEMRFRNLERNTTYCFWISPNPMFEESRRTFNPISPADWPFYENLELTLYDEKHRELKYNDGYSSPWSNGRDTLAIVRLRTTDVLDFDTVYLKISACGENLSRKPFWIHMTQYQYDMNTMMARADSNNHFGMRAISQDSIQPIVIRAHADHMLGSDCGFETVIRSKPVAEGFLNAPTEPVAEYESGAGFGVRKERCAGGEKVDDRLECTLHNFRAFWFKPPTTGVYTFTLMRPDRPNLDPSRGEPSTIKEDSLGIAIFADEDLINSNGQSIESAQLHQEVAARLMRICDDIGPSPRMMGSGKYFKRNQDTIVAGPSMNEAEGLLLGADSIYYVLVSAPMFDTFTVTLSVERNDDTCSLSTTSESSDDNSYNFHTNGVVSYCPPAISGGPNTNVANIQDNLPHLKMESQWTDFCWYKIPAPDPATEMEQYTVKSEFEGKLAFYTYGDINDFTTYTLIKHQLFGFDSQPPTIRFSIPHVPQQEMLMLIGHNQGQSGIININMTEVRPFIPL